MFLLLLRFFSSDDGDFVVEVEVEGAPLSDKEEVMLLSLLMTPFGHRFVSCYNGLLMLSLVVMLLM
jgi:hypothetical protein